MLAIARANPEYWPVKDARRERKERIKGCRIERRLIHKAENLEIIEALESCEKGRRCTRMSCPICVRLRQNELFVNVRECIPELDGHSFITLIPHSPKFQVDELDDLNLGQAKNSFRQQVRRKLTDHGLDVRALGVLEPSYDRTTRKWSFHFHVIFFGLSRKQLKPLKRYYRLATPRGAKRAKSSNIKPTKMDVAKCVSYIAKFVTYERSKSGDTLSQGKKLAVRPSRTPHNKLLRFYHGCNFDSLVFKIGLGPRGELRAA